MTNKRTKHGMYGTPTYKTWTGVIARCERKTNSSYPAYGGKGVRVCEKWRNSFQEFMNDMGERPACLTIDRIDNSKGYEPGNCRWASVKDQNNNKGDTRQLTLNGKTMNMSAWAREIGTSPAVLSWRLRKLKMTVEDALTIPVSRSNSGNARRLPVNNIEEIK